VSQTSDTDVLDIDETLKAIKGLITGAHKQLWLVCPYFRPPPEMVRDIRDAVKRGVEVELLVRADGNDREVDVEERLRDTGASLREVARLHAKVYANDSEALVSSLNLTESSFNNVEVSVRLRGAPLRRVHSMLEALIAGQGHCIRCEQGIAFDPKQPHCEICYEEWAEYQNADYGEKYCHRCAQPHRTSRRKPLCKACFAVPA
jgi:hypothetical protein